VEVIHCLAIQDVESDLFADGLLVHRRRHVYVLGVRSLMAEAAMLVELARGFRKVRR
jgi:hypothetical protein